MSRGFLSGAAWGAVVAGFGLAVASQMFSLSGPKMADVPQAGEPAAVEAVSDAGTAPQVLTPEPSGEAAPVATEAVDAALETTTKATQEAAADAPADVAPSLPQDAVPDLAGNGAEVAAAPVVPESFASPTAGTAPLGPGSDAAVEEPASDSQIATVPEVQTAAPGTLAPAAITASPAVSAPQVSVAVDTPPKTADGRVTDLPDSTLADTPPAEADLPPPAPEETASVVDELPAPEGNFEAQAEASDTVQLPEPEPEPAPTLDTPTAPDQMATAAPLRPAPGFGGKVEGVRTGRLPSIGGAAAPETTQAATADSEANDVAQGASETATLRVDDLSLPAIDRFARVFENPDGKPLFAILLQDIGGPDIDRETLAKLPFAVSFIIDPAAPDAALAAKIYRDAGQEVLMLATGIPAGATASDLSVSFEAMAGALPEAVGVVDQSSGGFQGNRTLSAQVLALVADQGRGVMTWDRGLNAASQIARRDGMRSALIFRALDADGESAPVIRRYLDRAAFKAAQDGRVVVAGQTRPETVAALLEWAVEGRASTVAIAPASAAMTAQ